MTLDKVYLFIYMFEYKKTMVVSTFYSVNQGLAIFPDHEFHQDLISKCQCTWTGDAQYISVAQKF